MNMAILIATFAVALFNASADDISRYFAYFYALVSVGVLVSPSPVRRASSITHGLGRSVIGLRIHLVSAPNHHDKAKGSRSLRYAISRSYALIR